MLERGRGRRGGAAAGAAPRSGRVRRTAVGLALDLVALAQVAHAERRGGADARLEATRTGPRRRGCGAPRSVSRMIVILSVMPCSASRTMIFPVRADARQTMRRRSSPGRVLAHAVELEARRPRLRDGRPDRRVLELAGERPVGDELDAGVDEQLERLGDDGLALGQAERVAGDGDERADLVHAAARGTAGCSGATPRCPTTSFVIGTLTGAAEPLRDALFEDERRQPPLGRELDARRRAGRPPARGGTGRSRSPSSFRLRRGDQVGDDERAGATP